MAKRRFLIGTDSFKEYRQVGGYFVDKSGFISDVVQGDKVTLIPRPRRFGKTLNLTMLKTFFELDQPGNGELFRGLNIEQDREAMGHLGGHPTIYLSLKDVRATDWEGAMDMLVRMIAEMVRTHECHWKKVENSVDSSTLSAVAEQRASSSQLKSSLSLLCNVLYEVTGKPVVLLIDEYDTPVIHCIAIVLRGQDVCVLLHSTGHGGSFSLHTNSHGRPFSLPSIQT